MKKALVFFLGVYTFTYASVNVDSCKSCHGQDWEKAALGASKIVKDMTKDEVSKALIGYKYGTYGRNMKGVMQEKLKQYTVEQLKSVKIGE